MKAGHVTPLPKKILNEVISLLKDRPSPAILAEIDPVKSGNVGTRIASLLSRGKISVRVVDLGPDEGFRRENARPTCEVLLVEKDGEILWEGKKRFRTEPGAFPRVFLPKAFLEQNASRPHVIYQAIVHPILEWVFGYPHMIAVLCESAYNATPPEGAGSLSDLNRYIAEGAGRDSDFPYFDRILVDAYEPEDFRKEELSNFFGGDEGKVGTVLARAREMGVRYRERVAEIREGVRGEIAARQVAAGRAALEEGDSERALHLLRNLVLSPETPSPYREEAADAIAVAIRSYALGADPAFEGVTVAAGEVTVESGAGPRARDLSRLLSLALSLARTPSGNGPGVGETVAGGPVPRIVHVVRELERPSGKFIDGNDGVHWVFEKGFVLRLLSGMAEGNLDEGIPALLACPPPEGRLLPGREALDRAAILGRRQGDPRGVPFLPVAPGEDAEADGGNVRAAPSGRSAVPPFRVAGDGGESRPRQPHDPEHDGPNPLVPARPVPGHRPRGKGGRDHRRRHGDGSQPRPRGGATRRERGDHRPAARTAPRNEGRHGRPHPPPRSHEPDPFRTGRRVRSEIRRGDVRADREGVRPHRRSVQQRRRLRPGGVRLGVRGGPFRRVPGGGQRPPHRFLDGVARGGEDHGGATGRRDDRHGGNILRREHPPPRPARLSRASPVHLRAVRQARPRGLPCVGARGKNDHRALPQPLGGLHGADPAGKRRLRQGVEGARPHRAQRSPGSAGARHSRTDGGARLRRSPGLRRARARGRRRPVPEDDRRGPPPDGRRHLRAASRRLPLPRRAFTVPRPGRQGRAAGGRRSPFRGRPPDRGDRGRACAGRCRRDPLRRTARNPRSDRPENQRARRRRDRHGLPRQPFPPRAGAGTVRRAAAGRPPPVLYRERGLETAADESAA